MMSRKLVMFIKFLFKVGVILGIHKFSFDKNTGQFVKSKCLSIYNFFVWTIVILYTPYEFYNAAIVEIQLAGSDQNGIFLIAITYFGVFSTLYLSTITMFYCLHFGKHNLLDLLNKGIELYRSVRYLKISPEPPTDRIFWLLFMKMVVLGVPMALLVWSHLHEKSAIFTLFFMTRMCFAYTFCLDLRNLIFLVAAHLMKLLRMKFCNLTRRIGRNNSSDLAKEFRKFTKLYQEILDFVVKVDDFLSIHTSSLFLYLYVEMINLVANHNLKFLKCTLYNKIIYFSSFLCTLI
jgi:hypothetical protein